ncbi:hypothetical protein OPQ81_000166 [Rhizoctonia solani]|nr:hypothetical protein OPQ81_000166 [Rhizoctonia solani]
MFDSEPHLGTATTPVDGYADLSLVPMGGKSATIGVLAETPSLKIYLVEGKKKKMTRQVTWMFQEKQDLFLGVGIFAARPTKVKGEETRRGQTLAASFEGL